MTLETPLAASNARAMVEKAAATTGGTLTVDRIQSNESPVAA
jgi:hypothetical protein